MKNRWNTLKLLIASMLLTISHHGIAANISNFTDKTICRITNENHSPSQLTMYRNEAKKRGLVCVDGQISHRVKASNKTNAKPVSNNCSSNNLAACNNKEICTRSSWSYINSATTYKNEALKRGLNCVNGVIQRTCKTHPASCSDKELCGLGTRFINGQYQWEGRPTYVKHASEAKRRGLTCNVPIANTKPCSTTNPAACSNSYICSRGTRIIDGKKQWDDRYKPFVTEAQKRKLNCGVPDKISRTCNDHPVYCNDSDLCNRSTKFNNGNTVWGTTSESAPYKKEAQHRGLSCSVKVATPNTEVNTCKTHPDSCNNAQLCSMGTRLVNGKRQWETRAQYISFANLAKSKGLACDVTKPIEKPVSESCISNPISCTNNHLCSMATRNINSVRQWDKRTSLTPYVLEARKRGLSCNVQIKSAPAVTKTCETHPSSCTQSRLCNIATRTINFKLQWETTSKLIPYVREAKSRGLSCGISISSSTQNKSSGYSTPPKSSNFSGAWLLIICGVIGFISYIKLNSSKKKHQQFLRDQQRIESAANKSARDRAEEDRAAEKLSEKNNAAKEKAKKEQAEREKVAKDKAKRERAAREKAEKERLARKKAAIEKAKKERDAREKVAKEKAERERWANEKLDNNQENDTSEIDKWLL